MGSEVSKNLSLDQFDFFFSLVLLLLLFFFYAKFFCLYVCVFVRCLEV